MRTKKVLFSFVNSGVFLKGFCTGKALRAMNTKIGFLSSVASDMNH
jgi:hypothetical protein